MHIQYTYFSEKGKRSESQDFIKILDDKDNQIYAFILCDGIGGHMCGGLASKIVANSISRDLLENPPKQGGF